MTDMTDDLVRYLAERDRFHAQRVEDVLARLSAFEFRLATEAAVMGWVQGFQQAKAGADDVGDFRKLPVVVDACLSMPELYPILAALGEGLRPEDAGFVTAVRRHQFGEEGDDD